jgi:hypothetical protein
MIDRLALILLLAGCVLFTGIVVAEVIATPAAETEAATAGATLPAESPSSAVRAGPGLQLDAMVAEILARPLFSSTRRPPPRSDGPAADTGLSDTRLTGIVTEPGHRFAIFAPSGAKPLVVSEGETISGWRVENITPREVSLTGPEGTKTLQPKIDPNLIPPPPPAGAAPPVVPIRPPAVVSGAARPGLPAPFVNRAPFRPGQPRERR